MKKLGVTAYTCYTSQLLGDLSRRVMAQVKNERPYLKNN
jgi:hypothetical protein